MLSFDDYCVLIIRNYNHAFCKYCIYNLHLLNYTYILQLKSEIVMVTDSFGFLTD